MSRLFASLLVLVVSTTAIAGVSPTRRVAATSAVSAEEALLEAHQRAEWTCDNQTVIFGGSQILPTEGFFRATVWFACQD